LLKFVAGDGFEKNMAKIIWLWLLQEGMLEIFAQSRVQELLSTLSIYKKIIFIAIERTGGNPLWYKNPNSEIYG
jgi:hypothetical protein